MNVLTRLSAAVVFLFPAVLVPSGLLAQTSNGAIAGSVVDPRNAVVPKAEVKAVSPQFGEAHVTQTDDVGVYRLESLQPGIYNVTISAAGFANLQILGVVVNGSLTTTVNGKLTLATAEQTIEIYAPASQIIDTQSGQLGETLNHQQVTQLPYLSFNPAELAMTLPGVQDTPQAGVGAVNTTYTNGIEISVNGTRPRANNFLIDGQDDNDYQINGQAYQPTNIGAIQEVTILTNAYSAEFGRGGGSVTNYIFKSGTNDFHGDLWEINANSAMAAIPAQDVIAGPIAQKPYNNENTFGFDIGGPVKKDELFFFGTAQWDRLRESATGPVFTLPTAAGIETLKTAFPNNANVNLFLQAIGHLVSPGLKGLVSIPTGQIGDPNGDCPCVDAADFQTQNVATASNAVDWNIRLDWHIGERDTLTGSFLRDNYKLSPDNYANPDALPGFQTEQEGPSQIARTQWLHTFSPHAVNELRFSSSAISIDFPIAPATASNPLGNIPWIQFGKDYHLPAIGVDSAYPQGRDHKTFQFQDAVSYSAGRHNIKIGADITHVMIHDILPLNQRGTILYNEGGMYTSLGNFIADYTGEDPGTISRSTGNPNLHTSATMVSPYIEDAFHVRDNLTINMGLRYEYWGAMANALQYPAMNLAVGFGAFGQTFPDLFSARQVPDKRNFAPRLSLAYTPHWGRFLFGEDKTVLRAGYGIFYDGLFSNIVDQTAESQPNVQGGSIPTPFGRGQGNASTFPNLNGALIFTMASHLHNPLTQQWNVNVQRDLPLGLVMTLAYVGSRGEHLFAPQDFNPQINYSYINTNTNFQEIAVRTNAGDSRYDSGQVEFERNVGTGLTLRASYTYSKFFDDISEIYPTTGVSVFSQDLANQRSDWGPSAFDRRHRFTVAYIWQAPHFKDNLLLKVLTDRWQWSGIATLETGTPNTVSDGFDNIGNGHPNSRPNLANPNAPLNSLGIDGGDIGQTPGTYYDFVCLFVSTTPCNSNPQPYDTFHFVIPNGGPGDVGRNSLFGPGQAYFDTAVQRDFPVHFWKLDHQMLQFRAELFNAFNHPNLFTPSYNMYDVNYDNTAITINGGRQIRLWLKYTF